MKLKSISFTPKAQVAFSDDDIDLLMECSARHYDGVCKDAGKVGGFLYGISCWREHDSHPLNFRQLDTLSKIAEQGSLLGADKAEFSISIIIAIRQILIALNDETLVEKEMP